MMSKYILILSVIFVIFSSCVSNMATRASFAPLFEEQGQMTVKTAIAPYSLQGDIKVAAMENIAVGLNGNVTTDLFATTLSSSPDSYNSDKRNYFGGGEIGYFNHFRHFYFDCFGGYGIGMSQSIDNKYQNQNVLNTRYKQFSFQLDLAYKDILITQKRAFWLYYAVGCSPVYEYNKVDLDVATSFVKNHFVSEKIGMNVFYRVGAQRVQFEAVAGFRFPLSEEKYQRFILYEEELGHFSIGLTFNISSIFKKKN